MTRFMRLFWFITGTILVLGLGFLLLANISTPLDAEQDATCPQACVFEEPGDESCGEHCVDVGEEPENCGEHCVDVGQLPGHLYRSLPVSVVLAQRA